MEIVAKLFGKLLVFVYHCFDRIVINGYLSGLSRPEQVVYLFRQVVGVRVVDREILSRRTNNYQIWVESFAKNLTGTGGLASRRRVLAFASPHSPDSTTRNAAATSPNAPSRRHADHPITDRPVPTPKYSASGRWARKCPDSRPRTRMLDSSRAQQYYA